MQEFLVKACNTGFSSNSVVSGVSGIAGIHRVSSILEMSGVPRVPSGVHICNPVISGLPLPSSKY